MHALIPFTHVGEAASKCELKLNQAQRYPPASEWVSEIDSQSERTSVMRRERESETGRAS